MAAAAFLGGQSRLKAGCGQNCPPSKIQTHPLLKLGAFRDQPARKACNAYRGTT